MCGLLRCFAEHDVVYYCAHDHASNNHSTYTHPALPDTLGHSRPGRSTQNDKRRILQRPRTDLQGHSRQHQTTLSRQTGRQNLPRSYPFQNPVRSDVVQTQRQMLNQECHRLHPYHLQVSTAGSDTGQPQNPRMVEEVLQRIGEARTHPWRYSP